MNSFVANLTCDDELSALARLYGTDKCGWHTYTPLYHSWFGAQRHTVTSLLELGVHEGASLRMWRDYFPNAAVHGADVRPPLQLGERILVRQVDLEDFRTYSPLLDSNYDLIIDDASHSADQQMLSLALLWPRLKSGGMYLIEDVVELAAFTGTIARLFAPVLLFDRRGPHNSIDDVLIALRKP